MLLSCAHRAGRDADACVTDCPATASPGFFHYARIERGDQPPQPDPRTIDIALLDMHHGWPNLGHDALLHMVQTAVCDMREHLARAGISVRVISYDIRRGSPLPAAPGWRHAIYIGTGGPGHLDPVLNDGGEGSQGIVEDPAWQAPLFDLFDAIRADPRASLFAVCHTFGVMCRWLGVADAVLRGPDKGGKSSGVLDNTLTADGRAHPWFARFAETLTRGDRFPVLDNRLYDMIPRGALPNGVSALSVECTPAGTPGEALTMIEVARAEGGVMPRILGVNHHPEIGDRHRQLLVLKKKRARGDVDPAWFAERLAALTQPHDGDAGDEHLLMTSGYTLMAPLRFMIHREIRLRGESLDVETGIDEHDWPPMPGLIGGAATAPI
jgi:hypothetical protein